MGGKGGGRGLGRWGCGPVGPFSTSEDDGLHLPANATDVSKPAGVLYTGIAAFYVRRQWFTSLTFMLFPLREILISLDRQPTFIAAMSQSKTFGTGKING